MSEAELERYTPAMVAGPITGCGQMAGMERASGGLYVLHEEAQAALEVERKKRRQVEADAESARQSRMSDREARLERELRAERERAELAEYRLSNESEQAEQARTDLIVADQQRRAADRRALEADARYRSLVGRVEGLAREWMSRAEQFAALLIVGRADAWLSASISLRALLDEGEPASKQPTDERSESVHPTPEEFNNDKWVNAVIELTFPLDVGVDQPGHIKQEAAARLWERLLAQMPDMTDHCAVVRWAESDTPTDTSVADTGVSVSDQSGAGQIGVDRCARWIRQGVEQRWGGQFSPEGRAAVESVVADLLREHAALAEQPERGEG